MISRDLIDTASTIRATVLYISVGAGFRLRCVCVCIAYSINILLYYWHTSHLAIKLNVSIPGNTLRNTEPYEKKPPMIII